MGRFASPTAFATAGLQAPAAATYCAGSFVHNCADEESSAFAQRMHFDERNSPNFRTAILQLTAKSCSSSGDGGALIVDEGQVVIEARNGRIVLANTRELLHGVLPGEDDRGALVLYSQEDVETWAALANRVAKTFGVPME
jgi:hypothetical protein